MEKYIREEKITQCNAPRNALLGKNTEGTEHKKIRIGTITVSEMRSKKSQEESELGEAGEK